MDTPFFYTYLRTDSVTKRYAPTLPLNASSDGGDASRVGKSAAVI